MIPALESNEEVPYHLLFAPLMEQPLELDAIRSAIQKAAFDGLGEISPYLPNNGPGQITALKIQRHIGEHLVEKFGYTCEKKSNQVRFLSPATPGVRQFRIIPCSGEKSGPVFKVNRKGKVSKDLAASNKPFETNLFSPYEDEPGDECLLNIWAFYKIHRKLTNELIVYLAIPGSLPTSTTFDFMAIFLLDTFDLNMYHQAIPQADAIPTPVIIEDINTGTD